MYLARPSQNKILWKMYLTDEISEEFLSFVELQILHFTIKTNPPMVMIVHLYTKWLKPDCPTAKWSVTRLFHIFCADCKSDVFSRAKVIAFYRTYELREVWRVMADSKILKSPNHISMTITIIRCHFFALWHHCLSTGK